MKFAERLRYLFIAPFLILCFFVCGCKEYSSVYMYNFNTQIYIAVKGDISPDTEKEIKAVLDRMEFDLSLKEEGDIGSFNAAAAGERIAISENAEEVISAAKELFEFTDGLFNPAVLPLLRLWKLSADTFDPSVINITPPKEEEISSLLPLADFSKVKTEENYLYKTEDGIEIDLGGIAKGYAADKIKDILSGAGVKEGYISIGGSSIFVFDTKENLSVKHPRKAGEYIFTVDREKIKNSAVSTSGDYMRYYTDEAGNRYCHVIDPFSGKPAGTGFTGVTVILPSGSSATADALSTAIMLMERDAAVDFIKNKLEGALVFAVYQKDGEKEIITNAQSGYSLKDQSYSFVKI